jgi:uncharacterized metal-binding protein
MYACDVCTKYACYTKKENAYPSECATCDVAVQEAAKRCYLEEENFKIAYNSALVESEGYGVKNRLEEIIDFADKCGFKKLGVAMCLGLAREGNVLCKILRDHGFEVDSVICKNGAISKAFIKITDNQQVHPGRFEPMCNPIAQAKLLNAAQTDFNIVLGLCVGHDSLFIKYSLAPVTVFAVKDRVLRHNPLAAIYQSENYKKKE